MPDQLPTIDHLRQAIATSAVLFGPRVLVALGLIIAGVFAARWLARLSDRALRRLELEPPVRQLLVRIIWIVVIALFAILALQNLGVELLPLIAGVSVAGAGVALALQGVLGNIVAGLTIIFTKPFRVGEYISIAGEEGQVQSITLSSTVLSHPDMSQVVIPNRKIVGEILHNYGRIRQIEIPLAVRPDADLDKVLAALNAVIQRNAKCLRDPAPVVAVSGFANGAIGVAVKPWVPVSDYSSAASDLRRAIVAAFRDGDIALPPPASEVQVRDARG